jgi:hypothetical protein
MDLFGCSDRKLKHQTAGSYYESATFHSLLTSRYQVYKFDSQATSVDLDFTFDPDMASWHHLPVILSKLPRLTQVKVTNICYLDSPLAEAVYTCIRTCVHHETVRHLFVDGMKLPKRRSFRHGLDFFNHVFGVPPSNPIPSLPKSLMLRNDCVGQNSAGLIISPQADWSLACKLPTFDALTIVKPKDND